MIHSALLAFILAAHTVAPQIETATVATGFKHPWSMAFLPDGHFLVSEKEGGLVRVAPDGAKFAIAGMPEDVDRIRLTRGDNSGLFDVALHPDFAQNRRLYFAYASKDSAGTTTRLATARLLNGRLVDVRVLFDATPRSQERFHYGGGLLIDRDGLLYLTVGERLYHERDNPPLPGAQDPTSRHGKIYRFTLDGQPAPGNPDFGPGAVPGLYATGIRAAQGLAQDRDSGVIWMSEHGPTRGDEINVLRPGANYGWPVKTDGSYRDSEYRPKSSRRGLHCSRLDMGRSNRRAYWADGVQRIAIPGVAR
jgi:glucose/arabinose dehydrogenase